jgi:hypothetical protein
LRELDSPLACSAISASMVRISGNKSPFGNRSSCQIVNRRAAYQTLRNRPASV